MFYVIKNRCLNVYKLNTFEHYLNSAQLKNPNALKVKESLVLYLSI